MLQLATRIIVVELEQLSICYFSLDVPHREGMIVVNNSGLTGDPTTAKIEIDRRMLDFCVGLDTEFSEIVEGSHLYYPKTKFDQVCIVYVYLQYSDKVRTIFLCVMEVMFSSLQYRTCLSFASYLKGYIGGSHATG